MREEVSQYGEVVGVCVAVPGPHVQDLMPGRCYVKYANAADAAKGG